MKEQEYFVELVYEDDSTMNFSVKVSDSWSVTYAMLSMITRGTLMTSSACRATCYNDEGFDVCSYVR